MGRVNRNKDGMVKHPRGGAATVGEGHLTEAVAWARGTQPLLPRCLAKREPDLLWGLPVATFNKKPEVRKLLRW